MRAQSKPVSVFAFLDYRIFLRETYLALKKTRAGFSFRTFSERAGFGSSNFYKLVMDGDRNLSSASAAKFAKGLGLNKQETDFFLHLVDFTQAENAELKQQAYHKLLQSRKFNELKPVVKDQYELYSTWYHPVVLELAAGAPQKASAEWISKKIRPTLSVDKVEKSLELLIRLGFLKKNCQNSFDRSQPLYTTGPEASSVILHNYHQAVLSLCKKILPEMPAAQRDVSALTLGVRRDKIPLIKKRVAEFRQEILKLVATEDQIEDVVLLAIQMFPVTEMG